QPSPLFRRVGVHIITLEACSGFTRVTARAIANLPKGDIVPAASARAGQVATESNRQLLGWIFHPLVLSALVAHQIFPIYSRYPRSSRLASRAGSPVRLPRWGPRGASAPLCVAIFMRWATKDLTGPGPP